MALVNHAKKEINAKIVYYGPPGSGKNSALTYIYSRIKPSLRGDLRTVPAGSDNLLFFDFSPFDTPLPNGYRVRLHVYTLTGSVTNPATWKMTLKGADGIMIMIIPDAMHKAENRVGVSHLRDFLSAYGVSIHETPTVLQLNSITKEKKTVDIKEIAAELDLDSLPACSSNAAGGEGILEALTTLSRQVLDRITVKNGCDETDNLSDQLPETEADEPVRNEKSVVPDPLPHTEVYPQVVLLSHEVISEGKTIRIPLEITHGGALRRLIVTVGVVLE